MYMLEFHSGTQMKLGPLHHYAVFTAITYGTATRNYTKAATVVQS